MVLSQDPKIVQLRQEMEKARLATETAAYAYFCACDVGDERVWASNIYDIVRTAPREAKSNI